MVSVAASSTCPLFAQLCRTAGCEADFVKWMEAQCIYDAETYGLLGSTEDAMDKVEALAEAAGVKFANIGKRASVKKLWAACRRILVTSSTATSSNAPAPSNDDPVPPENVLDLNTEFERRRHLGSFRGRSPVTCPMINCGLRLTLITILIL